MVREFCPRCGNKLTLTTGESYCPRCRKTIKEMMSGMVFCGSEPLALSHSIQLEKMEKRLKLLEEKILKIEKLFNVLYGD